MINENLKKLRKVNRYTQEEIAEILNVSRQAVAKWERGETLPDISNCVALANLYNVTLDNLVHYNDENTGLVVPPKGKHFFGAVKVDENGSIILPKEARDVFAIKSGDELVVVGDEDRGLAMVPQHYMSKFFDQIAFCSEDDE